MTSEPAIPPLPYEDELRRRLAFDRYGRYVLMRQVIERNRRGDERLRILDVGGRGKTMQYLFPQDEVFYLDPLLESSDPNFIRADGCRTGLDDASFDWATSADVLEHVTPADRRLFVEEQLRIARRGVLLAAPFHSPAVERTEKLVDDGHRLYHDGKGYPWLQEHVANGLPRAEELEALLHERGLAFETRGNNLLVLWQLLVVCSYLVEEDLDDEIAPLVGDLHHYYNTHVFPFDHLPPSYRRIYLIRKEPDLLGFPPAEGTLDQEVVAEVVQRAMDIVARCRRRQRERAAAD